MSKNAKIEKSNYQNFYILTVICGGNETCEIVRN